MNLAIIVQRYGAEVIGGAERQALQLAERLAARHSVTVLTTCARDYRHWANELEPGERRENGVRVRRFSVQRQRDWERFARFSRFLFTLGRILPQHRILRRLERRWVWEQGPVCPGLIRYLHRHRDDYDTFLFLTYLYYPTLVGLPLVAPRAVLIPTAHDEPALGLSLYRGLFQAPRSLLFMTEEERELVHGRFQNRHIPHRVIGLGVDLSPVSGRDEGYLLYMGRIESGKDCPEMFDFCRRAGIPLKAVGPAQIPVPSGVEYLGVVGEEEKARLLAACRGVVVPSRNESLSLAVLEAWGAGKPVLVSARSPVLVGQIRRSGGGRVYAGLEDFARQARALDPAQGLNGRRYVQEHYSWEKILPQYEEELGR